MSIAEVQDAQRAWQNATSFRRMTSVTAMGLRVESDSEVVKPDREHAITSIDGDPGETIQIGMDLYTREGSRWTRDQTDQPVAAGANKEAAGVMLQIMSQRTDPIYHGPVHTVSGVPCQDWVLQPAPPYTSTVCIGLADHLIYEIITRNGNTTRYADWNKPFTIEAPR